MKRLSPKKPKVVYDTDTSRRRTIGCISIATLLLLIGISAGIAIGIFVFDVKKEDKLTTFAPTPQPIFTPSPLPPIAFPTPTPPPLSPSATLAPTTIASPTASPITTGPTYSNPVTDNIVRASAPTTLPAAFEDTDSVQYQALTWLLGNENLQFYSPEKQLYRWTLAVFYYSTNGMDWLDNSRWLSDFDECTWYTAGVTACNSERLFANLVLGANNVVGTVPPELGLLSDSLQAINIRSLSADGLNGTLPTTLGLLTMLEELNVRGNSLSGDIPSQLSDLTALVELDLNGNDYTGPLPGGIVSSIPSLQYLDLGDCKFSGTIPEDFGSMSQLKSLVLPNNELNGTVPSIIGNMTSLEVLDLDSNLFTFVPRTIGDLINLKTFSVSNNNIQGTVHTEFGQLVNLEGFFISNNEFGFQIPSELGQLTKLRDGFDVSTNQLIGSVPFELGALTQLRQFRISGNRIAGNLPDSLSALSQLRVFRIDENDLTGEVPPALCQSIDVAEAVAYADCQEIACPCCTHCCVGGLCECQVLAGRFPDPIRCAGSRL